MEDKMPNQKEHKFINLSKPISDLYNEPVNYDNQEDIMPNGYNGYNNQQDVMPNGYNNQADNNTGFNPQAYQKDIYPKNSAPMYKEMSIPKSSTDIPTVQPSIVNPPIVQNNPTVNYQEQTKFCKYCGQKIHNEAVVCPHCGRQVEQLAGANNNLYVNNGNINNSAYPMPISPYSKNTSLILACLGFAGLGGIHRFYSGKYLSGLLYLLTGGLFMVGTIIDVIKLASGEFRDGNGFHIKNN